VYSSDHAYIRQIESGETIGFYASFACEDTTGTRWVLEPMPLALDQRLVVLSVEPNDSVSARMLPPLPYPRNHASRGILATFGPGSDVVSVVSYRENDRDPNWHAFRISIGQKQWEEITSEIERNDLRRQLNDRNSTIPSIAILGHVPASDFSFTCKDLYRGKNVQCLRNVQNWAGSQETYRLPSPDGKTFVTMEYWLPRAIWAAGSGKTALTHVATGKTQPLLQDTSATYRLFVNYIYGPCAFVILLPFMPNI